MEGRGLQARERCLLHLLQTSFTARGGEGRGEAPVAITQEGIAAALAIGRNNVPRLVAMLMAKGLVEARRERVRGFRSRKTVYYLTYRGLEEAKAIKARVEALPVRFVDLNGGTKEARVGEIPALLGLRLPLVEILNHIEAGGFDSKRYLEGRGRATGAGPSRLPRPAHFFGRQTLLAALGAALEGEGFRCAVVHGLAGVGKTSLVSAYFSAGGGKVYYQRIREWTTLRGLVHGVASFTLGLGATDLFFRQAQANPPGLEELLLAAGRDLSRVGATLVLDDFQNASGEVATFAKGLLELPPGFREFKLVLLSREVPGIYGRTRARAEGEIREIEVGGLAREEAFQLMEALRLPRARFEEIYTLTKGHPLLIELAAVAGAPRRGGVTAFLQEEVLSSLGPPDLALLRRAAVYRRPVPPEALGDPGDFRRVASLSAKSLLRDSGEGEYELHDLLREALLQGMTAEGLREAHGAAAAFYRGRGDGASRLELAHHLLEAGEAEAAAIELVASQEALLRAGYTREVSLLLARVDVARLPPSLADQVLLLRGSLAVIEGDWPLAEELLKEALARARALGEPLAAGRCLRMLGDLAIRRGQEGRAVELLQGAREAAEDAGDMAGLAATHYLLGSAFERRSDFARAREHFALALEVAGELGDDVEAGRSWLAFGRIDSTLGDHPKAIAELERAAEYIGRSGDLGQLAKVHTSLGISLCRLGRLREGIEHHAESVRLAERTGDLRTQAYALSNLGWAWYEAGDLAKAEAHLEKALAIGQCLGEGWLMPHIYLNLGVVAGASGQVDRARLFLREAVRRFQGSGPYESARALIIAGTSYRGLGLTQEAVGCLEEARRLGKEGGFADLEAKAAGHLRELNALPRAPPARGEPVREATSAAEPSN